MILKIDENSERCLNSTHSCDQHYQQYTLGLINYLRKTHFHFWQTMHLSVTLATGGNVFVGATDDFHHLFSGSTFGKGGVATTRVTDGIEFRNVLTEGDQLGCILEWLRVHVVGKYNIESKQQNINAHNTTHLALKIAIQRGNNHDFACVRPVFSTSRQIEKILFGKLRRTELYSKERRNRDITKSRRA